MASATPMTLSWISGVRSTQKLVKTPTSPILSQDVITAEIQNPAEKRSACTCRRSQKKTRVDRCDRCNKVLLFSGVFKCKYCRTKGHNKSASNLLMKTQTCNESDPGPLSPSSTTNSSHRSRVDSSGISSDEDNYQLQKHRRQLELEVNSNYLEDAPHSKKRSTSSIRSLESTHPRTIHGVKPISPTDSILLADKSGKSRTNSADYDETSKITTFSGIVDRFCRWLNTKRKKEDDPKPEPQRVSIDEGFVPGDYCQCLGESGYGKLADLYLSSGDEASDEIFQQYRDGMVFPEMLAETICGANGDSYIDAGLSFNEYGQPVLTEQVQAYVYGGHAFHPQCDCHMCSTGSSSRSSYSSPNDGFASSVYSVASDDTIGPLDEAFETYSRTSHLTLTSNLRLNDPRIQSSIRSIFNRKTPKLGQLKSANSCPTNPEMFPYVEPAGVSISASWPVLGSKVFEITDESDFDMLFSEHPSPAKKQIPLKIPSSVSERIGECTINYADIELGQCLRTGRKKQIFSGRWYGDVIVHKYTDTDKESEAEFWEDVSKLSLIRHENTMLFMGACVESPDLSIVISIRKTSSLHKKIHRRREKLTLHTKVSIARQVSQAMGYLHAKHIVMRKLNSKNIYLEGNKVKLAIVDCAIAALSNQRFNCAVIQKGHLSYVSPEMMTRLVVDPPKLTPTTHYTNETDVYAFGTVLYELLNEKYPFRQTPAESIIWQVGCGKRQSLSHVKCTSTLKNLIEDCWSHDPLARPEFSEISKELVQKSGMWKRHSSSEPEKLNRIGSGRGGLFYITHGGGHDTPVGSLGEQKRASRRGDKAKPLLSQSSTACV